jgi:transcriptional regulator with XRE-family HTH domain
VPWPSLEQCTPLGALLVEWMWAQRPPAPVALLATRLGVDRSTLVNWLTSDRQPQPMQLLLLAQVTELPLATLASAADAPLERVLRQRDVLWDYVEWEVGHLHGTPHDQDDVVLERLRDVREAARGALSGAVHDGHEGDEGDEGDEG